MDRSGKTVLVFGATGQQGGAVARALSAKGWGVTALVRDPASDRAQALAADGIQLAEGDFSDSDSIARAMAGVHGVFSVQPSSGQGSVYNVTDDAEIRWGMMVADLAAASAVQHFVYSSVNAAGSSPTGMGHFDSKAVIEDHIRALPIRSTILRPAAFMELLLLPGMGLDQGRYSFLMRPEQRVQCIAVKDIGRIVEAVLADPDQFGSRTFEIAGDAVTGLELAEKLGRASGRPITYHRLPDTMLSGDSFLGRLAALIDDGTLAGHADLAALRASFPGLMTLDDWLSSDGVPLLSAALQAAPAELVLR